MHIDLTVVIQKVNELLDQLHVDRSVCSVAEIGAGVFVTLFEGLCGEQLTGMHMIYFHIWV